MPQLLIIADDFTGALDTGVQFSKQGYLTSVTTVYPPDPSFFTGEADVLVADTESRHLPAQEAYARSFAWARMAKEQGVRLIYKKTDSTLRGNVGIELKAAMDATQRRKILFAPALPRLGRTVIQGEVFFQGVPLARTVFAKDPFTPVGSSFVKDIIHASAPELCVAGTTPSGLLDCYYGEENAEVLVVDAQTEGQMQEIALSAYALRDQIILAGCAGFAQMIPAMLEKSYLPIPRKLRVENCLFVSGSVNQIALDQIRYGQDLGIPTVLLQPRQLLQPDYWQTEEGEAELAEISETLREYRNLILNTANGEKDTAQVRKYASIQGILPEELHLRVADGLGRLTALLTEKNSVDLLCVFGGDTLYGILNHLQANKITPESEILPGVVQSVFSCERGERQVISKAGGFGDRDLIQKILQCFGLSAPETAAKVI